MVCRVTMHSYSLHTHRSHARAHTLAIGHRPIIFLPDLSGSDETIACPPVEVASSGLEAVLAFLREVGEIDHANVRITRKRGWLGGWCDTGKFGTGD